MLTHVVLFKLKTPDDRTIEETKRRIAELKEKIPLIRALEVGTDILKSERSYDVALIVRFDSLEDLGAYQLHPAHQELVQYLNEVRESSVSVDFLSPDGRQEES
ncbi:MAG: stress responsive protein [Candidatus Reconcilbacillus cellulovorans]|uniref:Stress responsive protein n=1 Tax=Candidatus Reconcilbacillus cellulovorans TaxID=1906605 RepID=A0A2A6DZ06_9BACL|nr:MAG: stress responsive protein [Candidatus Reconcilbacillus cellulovorans]